MSASNALLLQEESADFQSEPQPLADDLLVLRWVVPGAAQVPAPRQLTATVALRPAATSSTRPATVLTELRVSNTALGSAWWRTATLAAPAPRLRR